MSANETVADLLEEFADRLEATDVEYKPRAYRRAADGVRDHPASVKTLAESGTDALEEIDGVGEAIAAKIHEYVTTGTISELEALRADIPVDMDALTRVEGLGPKRVGALHEALGIETLDDLEAAATAGEIRTVSGFGEVSERNILEGIPFARSAARRHLLSEVRPVADDVLAAVVDLESVDRASVAGSIRRWRPTIGDVDVLVATADPTAVAEALDGFAFVSEIIESGDRKASIRTIEGLRTDFRFVDPDAFGAALVYFTGSKDHNVQLRQRAIDRDCKVNEYGVFRDEDRLASDTEQAVYAALDLEWIPPELREARGELEAAATGALPDLLEREALRGDIHVHSDWSDGRATIDEMVEAAADFGHEYVAITDHAVGPGVVADTGLDATALREQADAVATAAESASIDVYHGVEVNIDADGSLSLPDDALEALDLVIASPHAALDQPADVATDRLVRAVEHPAVDVLGHPTGRKLGHRPGLPVDVERVATAAAAADVALEVNSHPVRLDLDGQAVQTAIHCDAPVAISTDAHVPREFDHLRYGVHTARRGWAEAGDVVTARSPASFRDWLG